MEPTDKTIVVTGATGLQGRAVTRHLLDGGWHVRALTRNPDGVPAKALASTGAQIVRAEMEDISSLINATEGAYGLFSVQPTVGSPGTAPDFCAEDEVRWGMNIAEAAQTAGIRHLVFSSVAGADRHSSEALPQNLISKWRIEQHIAKLGMPATTLRPVSFMENYTGEYALQRGSLVSGIAPAVPLQIMAVDDVGFFTRLAFSRPQEWIGRAMALAGDELTPTQIAAHIETAIGRPLPYAQIPMETIRAVNEQFAFAHEWLNERGYRADIPATRRIHPAAMDFRTWLERTGATQITAFLDAQDAEGQDA
ncbi:NmrA/HSCARG family protein [Streptomyces europaeiscabiei]|uniref:NmrA/HSCARG family protein n=1 Tax=Streptomyces europaeiscabiei TaxID=146819 RepID=UPI000E69025D|nr:NmrA/HSCARG family protein [Streptomyces europaeiscabiei]MDX2529008.1 NmrA/HSCARG family protein [Streptomyces europaeiscabiei]MDX2767255.1 NmrA/HSCARG family protein [Streptomyces europaeiscabiei]MDX3714902.1 NmrA/HSCARG family protein [Streptomyces europaeiscabiei]MDX3839191.1 NmrA/HSCARG family protein [Streptomyces europaeiscabiei]MDX3846754.1 NmrA/HSCARG family protein [Streptomyces europaeiscabiei]